MTPSEMMEMIVLEAYTIKQDHMGKGKASHPFLVYEKRLTKKEGRMRVDETCVAKFKDEQDATLFRDMKRESLRQKLALSDSPGPKEQDDHAADRTQTQQHLPPDQTAPTL